MMNKLDDYYLKIKEKIRNRLVSESYFYFNCDERGQIQYEKNERKKTSISLLNKENGNVCFVLVIGSICFDFLHKKERKIFLISANVIKRVLIANILYYGLFSDYDAFYKTLYTKFIKS